MDSPEPLYCRARAGWLAALLAALVALAAPAAAAAADGDIVTAAGNGTDGSGGDGGQATSAQLRAPSGVAFSTGGELYIADYLGHKIRKVATNGVITTLAGTGSSGYSGDGGQATSAQLSFPRDLAVDAAGNVYIADSNNSRVRRVAPDGTITTFAGNGSWGLSGDGGSALLARMAWPAGLEIDAAGNVLVTDVGNHTVRKIRPDGTISRVAGTGSNGSSGDGGPATSAQVDEPGDVAVDGAGNLFITEYDGHRVRKVTPGGTISTIAGTGTAGSSGDGGPATAAQVNRPLGAAVDSSGNLFISEYDGHRVRKVIPDGTISRVAGTGDSGYSGDGGPAVLAKLHSPARVALSSTGDLYVSDFVNHRVRRVSAASTPAAPTFTSVTPASPANANTVAVKGEATSGATVRLYTNSSCTSAVIASGSAAAFSSTGFSVAVLDDTTTTFWATAEVGGRTSGCSSTSITFVEDSTGPSAPAIDSAPSSPSSDPTPTWAFSATEPGATFQCHIERDGVIVSNWAACTSPHTYDLSGQPDATYTFSVRAVDAAGNTGGAQTATYAFDRTVPATPEIDTGPGVTGNGRNPSWSFSSTESGVTFECRLDRGASQLSGWSTCSSPRSYDLTGEPDGTYTFSVRAKNAALTASPPATDGYVLDTTAPNAPSIDAAPASPGASRAPAWSFSGEAGASFECRLERGGAVVSAWASCSSGDTFDLAGEPDGAYTFSVRARDAAGNAGAASTSGYTLDTAAPGAPAIDAAPASPGSGRGPQWSFSGEAGAGFECRLERGGAAVSGWAACTSPRAYDLSGQPDGTYLFSVRARDAAGNTGSAAGSSYELDTTPGQLSIDSAPGPLGRDTGPSWAFSGESGAAFACRLARGSETLVDWTPCTSPWSADLAGRPDGAYTFALRSTDQAGNTGTPLSREYTLDTTPPAAPELASTPPARARDRTPSWSFTGEAGAGFECRVDRGGSVVADWSPCDGAFSANLADREDGAYTFAVRAIDGAGNTGAAATTTYRLDTAPPDAPRIESSPGRQGEDRTPRWGFRAEAGATLECRLARGGDVIFAWDECATPKSYDLRSQADGVYRFAVKATDAAGNRGPAATDDYELRTRAAGAPPPERGDSPAPAPASDGPGAPPPATDAMPASTPPASAPDRDERSGTPGEGPAGRGGAAGEAGSGGGGSVPTTRGRRTAPGSGPAPGGDAESEANRAGGGVGDVARDVTKHLGSAAKAVVEHPDKTVFPLSLVFIVGGFLVLQGRMDRNDPKLALAPVFADPDLEFSPPPSKK